MKRLWTLIALLGAIGMTAGCGDDGGDGGGGGSDCETELLTGDIANGQYCEEMDECQTGYCLSYEHTPADPDGVCADAPAAEGDVHVTANVRDFRTGEAMPGQEVWFSGAIEVMQNPFDYTVYESATADADARIDIVLTGEATQVDTGIVTVAEATGYYPTGTGLVEPEMGCGVYPPGIRNRDIKLVAQADIDEWSAMLLADFPELEPRLPLGDKGGVMGLIRGIADGSGIPGVVLVSRNADSTAQVFYLNEAQDGFVQDQSYSSGIFVIIGPGLAEKFDGTVAGEIVSRRPATMGTTAGVMFSTTMHIYQD